MAIRGLFPLRARMSSELTRRLGIGIGAVCIAYVMAAMTIFPSLFPDPAYGLLVQKSMRAGAAWNHMTEPRPDNIAEDHSYFYTVWSPGQQVVPGEFMALGLTLGAALTAVNILAALLGLAGWHGLFRALAFTPVVALGACLVVVASRTFGFSFLAYVGSDQLAFAGFPFLAWALLRARTSWALVLLAPVAVLTGFFLKNSMAVYVTAWCGALLVANLWSAGRSARPLAQAAAVIAAVGGAVFLLDGAYVSRGWTPMTYQPAWSPRLATYLLPTSMPILAGTGWDDLLSRVFSHPSSPPVDYKSSLALLVPLGTLTVAWAIAECRQSVRTESRLVIVAFVAQVVAVFTGWLATGSGASLSLSRHYMIPGVLLLPLLIERLLAIRSGLLQRALVVAMALPMLYGVLSFGANWTRHYRNRAAHSPEVGVVHLSLTPRVVQHLRTLDRSLPAGSLVVVPTPSLAFEFSRTRVLATSATSDGIPEFERTRWGGRVQNLVVIAELSGQSPEEIQAWLRSFTSYAGAGWSQVSADGFSYYVPGGQAINPSWLKATLAGTSADSR